MQKVRFRQVQTAVNMATEGLRPFPTGATLTVYAWQTSLWNGAIQEWLAAFTYILGVTHLKQVLRGDSHF